MTRRPLARRWSLNTTSGTDVDTRDLWVLAAGRRGQASWPRSYRLRPRTGWKHRAGIFRRPAAMPVASHLRRPLGGVAAGALLAVGLPPTASAHSRLLTADPPAGATASAPSSGPLVLTFSAPL